jgi:NDP-sugar pyrophosphorylase family protein
MILAAGFGTRLGDLTTLRPKPMLPICGAPLVRWAVLWLRSQGIKEIVINLHHLGDQIVSALGDGAARGGAIEYSREDGEILGTGGGLRRARALLDDGQGTPFVVVNGKIMLDLELGPVLAHHRERAAEATMVLRRDEDARRWGSLQLDARGEVVGMLGRVREGAAAGEPLMFTGVHVLQPRFLDRVPAAGQQCIVRTAYASLFADGRGLAGFVTPEYWWEHSTVARYLQGVRNVLEGRASLRYAERSLTGVDESARVASSAVIEGPVWIGAGASVGAGARVGPYAQLGAGASIASGVRVRDAVVWGGVRVETDTVGAVRVR